ncbi:MAG: methylmalonyl Co-A mutase-associated GTPase MeaB [Pseudomonadota bacterium]
MAASAQAWAARLRAGDRRALARAITRAESGRPDHRLEAEALIDAARPEPGARPAVRIGLSGSPGVGKSSFIEAFGLLLTAAGERVAVLAVDPSSSVSGGSILGDKTRMERLTRDPNAFIRPSPAGAQLGGVARRTRDAIQLVEAAGYSVVLVETVGVGQSEIMVADMTDVFALLIAPAGGDELQGVKRGVMEVADFVLVNKADGALEGPAKATVSDYSSALRLLRRRPGDPEDVPAAAPVSAHTGLGLAEAWDRIKGLHAHRLASGALAARRAGQGLRALRREIQAGLWEAFEADQAAAATLDALSRAVEAGEITPERAARVALAAHRGGEARGGE